MLDDERPLLESDLRATIESLTKELNEVREDISNLTIFVHHLATSLVERINPSVNYVSPPPYAYGSHLSQFKPSLNVLQNIPPMQMTLHIHYANSEVIPLPPAPTPDPGRTVWDIIGSG